MSLRRAAILFHATEGAWGGGNSFLRSLRKTWTAMGIDVLDGLDTELDGVLLNSSYRAYNRRLYPADVIRMTHTGYEGRWQALTRRSRWARKGTRPPFVHRLDGVFRLYGRRADDPADVDQARINRHVDWTIYQSEYCRKSFAAEGVDVSRSTVIFNGVDTERFYPASELPPTVPFRVVALAWSSNPRKGFQDYVAAAEVPGIELTFIGRWPVDLNPGRVRVIPPQTHEVLPGLLREHHALLQMSQNDACSNVILEGLASGLPVVYHPSGGSPEIVGESGIPASEELGGSLEELRDRYAELRERALARRQDLSIESIARRYQAVFESVGRIAI